MNQLDQDIRSELTALANTMHTTPPPIHTIPRLALGVAPRQRRVRRPLLIGAIAGTLLVGAGAAAAVGLLDDQATRLVQDAPCGLSATDAHRVASAQNSHGNTVEYWVVSSGSGYGDLLVERDPKGTNLGGALSCSPGAIGTVHPAGEPWAGAPYDTSDTETLISLFGWVPPTSAAAIVAVNWPAET